jgi:predicted alpha/beta-hydrolase family hydrolase
MAAGVVLFPGAGSSADHASLLAIERALAPLPAVRVDFPYRRAGRKAPDRAPVLVACVVEAVQALAARLGVGTDRLVIGGRSMGGRMCSMAVAAGLPVAGLVLISYPLHPPGKPAQLRTAHLPAVSCPCLFVSGTRDSFGTPDELRSAHALVGGAVEAVWVEGGGHDLKKADDVIARAVAEFTLRV